MLPKKQKQKNFLFKKRFLKKSGFTLVELLIVLAIVLIMTGAAISVIVNGNKTASEVESAAEQLVSKLKKLQNDAVNGNINNGGVVANCHFGFFTGARAETGDNNKKYASAEYPCQGGVTIAETSFLTARGSASSVVASSASTEFNVPFGDVSRPTSITLTAGMEHYYVCIAVGGSVSGGSGGQANIYAKKDRCL